MNKDLGIKCLYRYHFSLSRSAFLRQHFALRQLQQNMSSNRGKKPHLPLSLEPMMVSDRHSLLLGEIAGVAAEAPEPQKRGIFSEFLFDNTSKKIKRNFMSNPLPQIQKNSGLVPLPASRTYIRDDLNPKPVAAVKHQQDGPLNLAPEKSDEKLVINYRKALEPKVARPFVNRSDQTPRKVEMERKKRLYSSLDIKILIDAELDKLKEQGLLPQDASHIKVKKADLSAEYKDYPDELKKIMLQNTKKDVSQLLPLEAFDDTDFDTRTVDDWLDMTTIPNEFKNSKIVKLSHERKSKGYVRPGFPDVRFAVIPLPAKAFDGVEWRDCIVIAYDDAQNLWKLKWRSYNGWELDKKGETVESFVHPEDESLKEEILFSNSDPRECVDGKEVWTHRYT